jgi:hypothetical protein
MPMQPHRRRATGTPLALVIALAVLSGCDRATPDAPSAQAQAQPPAPAPAPPLPKPTFTLITTWMYGAQPPQTTQTPFRDQAACDQARDAAIAEGRRLALESIGDAPPSLAKPAPSTARRYIGSALLPGDEASPPPPSSPPPSAPPKVAAICAATSVP